MTNLFINKPNDFVVESIEGTVASVPHLKRLDGFPQVTEEYLMHYHTIQLGCISFSCLYAGHCLMQVKVIFDGEADRSKVAIISGL